MSVEFRAVTVVGVILKELDLSRPVNIRGCSHPENTDNFCTKCGKPIWVKDRRLISGYDPGKSTLDGTPLRLINTGVGIFVGVGLFRGGTLDKSAFVSITPDELNSIKDVVKSILKPLGLWHEEQFGIHTLLEVY